MKKTIFILAASFSVSFLSAQALSLSINWADVICNAACDGTATAVPSGGTSPYTFSWAPNSATTANIVGLCAGTYTCTVTDAVAATATATVTITQPPPLTVSGPNITPATYCEGQIVSCGCIPAGGTGPYNYMLNPCFCFPFAIPASSGTYTIIVTDANGCTASNTFTLTPYPNYIIPNPTISYPACNQTSGSISLAPTGGVIPYTYSWMPSGNTTSSISSLATGVYSVHFEDNTGCPRDTTFYLPDSCYYVWPGDANEDGVADNMDILDIGIANGATGFSRPGASLSWTAQSCSPWGQTLLSGTDYKYVDCDGDGAIANADTNAVVLNFGYTHIVRQNFVTVYDATLPDLSIHINQDSIGANGWGDIIVSLGSSVVPASNVYGVAFTLNFDPAQINSGSFGMTNNGSWMGTTSTDMMGVLLKRPNTSQIQVAITRTDHNDASGFGNIASIGFQASNNMNGSGNSTNVNFTVSGLTIISSNEQTQQANIFNDSVIVADPAILGVEEFDPLASFSLYPNPVNGCVNISLSNDIRAAAVTLSDATGRIVLEKDIANSSSTLDLSSLDHGVYFCTIRSEGNIVGVKRIVKE